MDIRYGELAELTARFAGALAGLGVRAGRSRLYAARQDAELYVAALGALRHRAIFCPCSRPSAPSRCARG